jgi:phosphatidylserine decarboxylase
MFCFMIRFGECWQILLVFTIIGALSIPTYPVITLAAASFLLFSLYFFRDPERRAPLGDGLIICPADGRVLDIEEIDDKFVGKGRRLSIFMSPFDVHVNRAPFDCKVVSIVHTPGKKVAAYLKGDLDARERNRLELDGPCKLAIEQYAGVVARRIVCWAGVNDRLTPGQRIGMIKFGSRVDVIAPLSVEFKVHNGERVFAGETIAGVMHG